MMMTLIERLEYDDEDVTDQKVLKMMVLIKVLNMMFLIERSKC